MCLWASIWERHGWVHLYPNEGAFPVKQSEAVALEKFYGNQRPGSLDELQVQLWYKKGGKFFKGWYLERLKDTLRNDKLIICLLWTHITIFHLDIELTPGFLFIMFPFKQQIHPAVIPDNQLPIWKLENSWLYLYIYWRDFIHIPTISLAFFLQFCKDVR